MFVAARAVLLTILSFTFAIVAIPSAGAATRDELDRASKRALDRLVAEVPAARALNDRAVAVLVFPSVTKAGFMVGGQYGEGVLWRQGKPVGYYNTAGASWGLQAGAQKYGYAMFFMRESAIKALDTAEGFEVGVGPSVVVIDQGMAKSVTSTTLNKDVYAFIFSQQGLMAGVGLQGNKITKIKK